MSLRVVTVKASGGSYSSLNAALVGEQANFVTLGRQLRVDCYPFTDTTAVNAGGGLWSTNATYNVTIRAVADHGGAWNANAYILSAASFSLVVGSLPGLRCEGLQVELTATASGAIAIGSADALFTRGIVRASGGRTGTTGLSDGTGGVTVTNTIVYGFDSGFFFGNGGVAYNCTAADCSINYAQGTFINCLSQAHVSSGFQVGGTYGASSDYNVSSGTTAPGTHSRTNQTATFRGAADYHLAASDTAARGYGTNLIALGVTDDIDGAERHGTWDVGADQYVAPTGWTLNDLAPVPVTESFAAPATAFSQRADVAPLAMLLETPTTGTTYPVSVAESGSAVESQSGPVAFGVSRAEAGTAADTDTAVAVFGVTRAEAGSAAETASGPATFAGAGAEVLTATASASGTADVQGATAETLSASETELGSVTLPVTVAESGAAAESQSGSIAVPGTTAESLTATSAESASAILAGIRAESLSSSATATGVGVFSGSRAEALTASDTDAATADVVGARAESVSVVDQVTGAADFALAQDETGAAAEAVAATADLIDAVSESAEVGETLLATSADEELAVESLSAADEVFASVDLVDVTVEALSASDAVVGVVDTAALAEDVIALDESSTGVLAGEAAIYDVVVDEALAAADASAATQAVPVPLPEPVLAPAAELPTEGRVFNVAQSDRLVARDRANVSVSRGGTLFDSTPVDLRSVELPPVAERSVAPVSAPIVRRPVPTRVFDVACSDALAVADGSEPNASVVGRAHERVRVRDEADGAVDPALFFGESTWSPEEDAAILAAAFSMLDELEVV